MENDTVPGDEQPAAAIGRRHLQDDSPEIDFHQQLSAEAIRHSFFDRLKYTLGKDKYSATDRDAYLSLAYAVRDRLVARWIQTQQEYYHQDAKRVYYLSMEFLIGRTLGNSMINLGITGECEMAMREIGYSLEELREMEWDAGLGNGGLGRLAACYLDSASTVQIPFYGYGIRYEYGIFSQSIRDGYQVETPDNWLRYGNPWEMARPEFIYPVRFYGKVNQFTDRQGRLCHEWTDTESILAMAYDTPVPGYRNNTVNTLRLWSAKSTRDFNLAYFDRGDYIRAVEEKNGSENVSKVLYPNDNTSQGKELRLKQEYFFVSATLQDIIRRYRKTHDNFDAFPMKVAVQLNDTHPAIAIAELMRLLVDEEKIDWDKAWDITRNVCAYTNHTVMPEALEKWRVAIMTVVLPRHMAIIYEINRRFLDRVWTTYPGDFGRMSRMSIIEEGADKQVRMANLAIIGSHNVNGVSALHTSILKDRIFRDFNEFEPDKFVNITNGITQRRWILHSNPLLSKLITSRIGDGWVKDLSELTKLRPFADDASFRTQWRAVKMQNKEAFARWCEKELHESVDPATLFDFQVKRIHEYKRQLLNVLHAIALYHRIRDGKADDVLPRTIFFSGKSAPGYWMAKLIIKLIHSVGHVINQDPSVNGRLKVIFLPNYRVSLAQKIMPASELSEQISTAGMEASGTGNMKFMINGALTIGTLDGANVEMVEEAGSDNMFIFGLNAAEVSTLREKGYNPRSYYWQDPVLKKVIDSITSGFFSPDKKDLFQPIVNALLTDDTYCLFADFAAYANAQLNVEKAYRDTERWTRMSIMNTAGAGKFSSDRSVREYVDRIWRTKPIAITMPENK
ncbi:MAG: glycogen/starch/alpha-glucan phosphorylase [Spirochaetes bacterium]|nr:glycogen/starch/alpha-glucan phosphorylase [Spirochaetota bacterium]